MDDSLYSKMSEEVSRYATLAFASRYSYTGALEVFYSFHPSSPASVEAKAITIVFFFSLSRVYQLNLAKRKKVVSQRYRLGLHLVGGIRNMDT